MKYTQPASFNPVKSTGKIAQKRRADRIAVETTIKMLLAAKYGPELIVKELEPFNIDHVVAACWPLRLSEPLKTTKTSSNHIAVLTYGPSNAPLCCVLVKAVGTHLIYKKLFASSKDAVMAAL